MVRRPWEWAIWVYGASEQNVGLSDCYETNAFCIMITITLALSATSNRLGYGKKYNKAKDIANFENSSLPTRRTSSSVLPSHL